MFGGCAEQENTTCSLKREVIGLVHSNREKWNVSVLSASAFGKSGDKEDGGNKEEEKD